MAGITDADLRHSNVFKLNPKVEASRREADQGQALPLANVPQLLRGAGAGRLALEPQGGSGSSHRRQPAAAPHGPRHHPPR